MAATVLVAYNAGSATSSDQTLAANATHTLIPITHGSPGKVVVQIKTSEGTYAHLKTLNFADRDWQITGPLVYRVKVRKAGCDVHTGGGGPA